MRATPVSSRVTPSPITMPMTMRMCGKTSSGVAGNTTSLAMLRVRSRMRRRRSKGLDLLGMHDLDGARDHVRIAGVPPGRDMRLRRVRRKRLPGFPARGEDHGVVVGYRCEQIVGSASLLLACLGNARARRFKQL